MYLCYCYNGFRIHDHEVSGREGEEIVNAGDVEQMGEGGTARLLCSRIST